MKMPKMFQGKKSRGQDVSPSSSMEKSSPSTSPRGSKKVLETQQSCPSPTTTNQRPLVQQISSPATGVAVSPRSEIEEVVPRKKVPAVTPEEFHQRELKEAFNLIDVNGDGKISVSELGVILRCLGENPTDEELQLMVKAVDADGDGQIDLHEFMDLNKMTASERGGETRTEELRAAFHVFDIDKNNQISAEDLHLVLRRLGEQSLTMEECCRMISSVDCDGDGFVNFEEFEKMMSTPVY